MILMNEITEKQFQSEEVRKVIDKKNKYDLLIVEAFPRQMLVLSHFFKVPMILLSSFGSSLTNYPAVGAPTHEFLYPLNIRQKLHNLKMWEKAKEMFSIYRMKYFYHCLEDDENAMLKRVFGDVPPISELQNNVDMLFLNIHPLWEVPRPVPPNVVHIHGIHEKPPKELPDDLKTYLDSSKHGVIFISFGTNVKPSLLPAERINVMINAFSMLPYDVLWKWDKDNMEGKSENIKLVKWVPQTDLLMHPKMKLFITQGGLQSSGETINARVPVIGIPMQGDQWYNVEQIVHHKIGLRVEIDTMTADSLRDAITTVIEDESYRRNVQRLRDLMHDEPEPPLQRAVWWTEYVLRHSGARHLRSPGANMPLYQYLELELVFTVLGVIVVGVTAVVLVLVKLYKLFRGVPVKKTKLKGH